MLGNPRVSWAFWGALGLLGCPGSVSSSNHTGTRESLPPCLSETTLPRPTLRHDLLEMSNMLDGNSPKPGLSATNHLVTHCAGVKGFQTWVVFEEYFQSGVI